MNRKYFTGRLAALVLSSVAASHFAASNAFAQTDGSFSVEDEFARELKLVETFKVYNAQLESQLASQEKAKTDIAQSIADAETLAPQIPPLMGKMIAALERFVAADLPFHLDERQASIQRLAVLMQEPNVSDSERFRQILDIYTVETEYGQSYEAYADELNEQPVDILRIGRLALFAQTRDQATSYSYNKTTKQWEELDASHNRNIRKAIKVAAKTIAPELLSLPISAPGSI